MTGSVGPLAYLAEIDVRRPERLRGGRGQPTTYIARAFTFEMDGCAGVLAGADPDRYVLDAQFVPRPDAVARLERHPYRPIGEPLAAYLRGDQPHGAHWRYRRDPDGALHLVERSAPGSIEPDPSATAVR